MKAAPFSYHRPFSVAEATALLRELGEGAKVLAGGQSLLPMLALRLAAFDHLVDVGRVPELQELTVAGDEVRVGAGWCHRSLHDDPRVAGAVPLVARAARQIGHLPIRTRGTLGGSLAHADPAAELPAVAVTLGTTVEVASADGRRSVAADDLFDGVWSTTLGDDEVLVAVRFPVWRGRVGTAVEEVARRPGDFALAGTTLAVGVDEEGRVDRCRIGLFGLGSTPWRARDAEQQVLGQRAVAVDAEALGRQAMAEAGAVPDDLHASAHSRRRLGAVVVARAWRRAIEEAVGG